MVSQISLDCDLCIGPDNLGNKDGSSCVPSSSQEQSAPCMPAVKKQTRQWAAWTRQEEESFFAALRQVGKNFEKITSRVQSKNKDQVRHYYYRLVRRMNKLLGPELCLDAKNSKDTNAAMLRWWSLLEKYSCKASKLHLKPRRFKIFVETLESQLLKDRRKNIKKRLSSGENNSSIPNIPTSNLVRSSGHDSRAVKMVLVDSQNIPKVGTGKGALFKRHINVGTNRTSCKVDSSSVKTVKSRRKTGLVSTAAYKRWEKAAIAGVSLVADAAEHLERVDTDKENVQEPPGHVGSQLVGNATHPFQMCSGMLNQNNTSTKLKLQLFPIDEYTRKALEMDHHNPYLELTLSTRKKMSSILEHLNRKWRNTTFLSEELMLFPYWAQRENLVGYQKWSKDSPLCAADVYYQIGSPSIFRLRYGWFSKPEVESLTAQVRSCTSIGEDNMNVDIVKEPNAECENPNGAHVDQHVTTEPMISLTTSPSAPIRTVESGGSTMNTNALTYHDCTTHATPIREMAGDLAVTRKDGNTDVAMAAGEWADSLTAISIGDLLTEAAPDVDANCHEFTVPVSSNCLQQIPFSCDSFDAAIRAHISKHQNKVDLQHAPTSHGPSIWDAEETCDAFAFPKTGALCDTNHNSTIGNFISGCKLASVPGPSAPYAETEELPKVEKLTDSSPSPGDMEDCRFNHPLEYSDKDFGALSDIYWPDSLGPLDLDIPSCRYHSSDLILSDSLGGGLNRLIANSLDAFQSCSFFGLDKKDPMSTGESQQTTPFSDFKIGGEV